MSVDSWGAPVESANPESIEAWNSAWLQAMHFVDDPMVTLESANTSDVEFSMGSVFCATYRVLGGTRPEDPALLQDFARSKARANSPREQAHVQALTHMVAGDFTKAGNCWDDIARNDQDFAAIRFAHDVYLHVGDDARRLRSSQRAFDSWPRDEPGWGFVAGQLSFALEEAGLYRDAESLGWEALNQNPLDLWARHALAHLYETLDDNEAAFALLVDQQDVWTAQDGLAIHIWWHLALRLIATQAYDQALEVYDTQVLAATTPFRLCDMSSLLWRLELVGVDVGDRWDVLADRFAGRPEWHTSGFVDVHGALIFARRSKHEAADRFFGSVVESHAEGTSENNHIFTGVVDPLISALRIGVSEPAKAVALFDDVSDRTHRIGGSIAQRELLDLTRTHFQQKSLTNHDALEAT